MKDYGYGPGEALQKRNKIQYNSYLHTSDTQARIDEIKKKYDTPHRRHQYQREQSKENHFDTSAAKSYADLHYREDSNHSNHSNHSNLLRESFAINRTEINRPLPERPSTKQEYARVEPEKGAADKYKDHETAFFQKMKEVKESFFNQQQHRHSLRNQQRPANRSTIKADEYVKKEQQLDPRVQNIDKINSKIKQILECLNENEKVRISKFNPTEATESNKHSARFGIENNEKKSTYTENREIERKVLPSHSQIQNNYQKGSLQSPKSVEKYSDKYYANKLANPTSYPQQTNTEQSQTKYGQNEHWKNKSFLNDKAKTNQTLKMSRSKSIVPVRSYHDMDPKAAESGKKINEEINRIQRKIQQFEQEKKKMNIEFTPFSYKKDRNSKSTIDLNREKFQSKKPDNAKSITKLQYPERSSVEPRPIENDYSFEEKKEKEVQVNYETRTKTLNSDFKIKLIPVPSSSAAEHEEQGSKHQEMKGSKYMELRSSKYQEMKGSKYQDMKSSVGSGIKSSKQSDRESSKAEDDLKNSKYEEMRKKTDEGIETRKKRVHEEHTYKVTNNIKRLVQVLCHQVKLDEDLRNAKMWLETVEDPKIFEELTQNINQDSCVSWKKEEVKSQFKLSEEENNPFFSTNSFEGSMSHAVTAFNKCRSYWQQNVSKKFKRNNLADQNFTEQKIDLEKKRYIELQDFVRFLNIESGTFYRNRDLILIFKRITKEKKMFFEELIEVLCGKPE